MKVPLLDLRAQWAGIEQEVRQAVDRVWESQRFIMGPEVEGLEREIAEYCECRDAVAVSSGTDAILCSLMSLGIGPGDEVITSPFTFFATGGCIHRLGARPIFVDIHPQSFNIDTNEIEKALTPRIKAIMPVHLFGQCANMDPILELAGRHSIPVIEDAAQAIGATYRGRKAGSMGTVGCFSFFPSKNLGGAGDGGIITTQDADLAERLRILRNHGDRPKYHHGVVGANFRLDAIQAAVLRVKLRHLESWHAGRRANAATYTKLLADSPVVTPVIEEGNVSIFNQFSIRSAQRNELRDQLTEAGIGTEVYYPIPLHLQECFADLGYGSGDFPHAEQAASEVLALPVYPELTEEQIEYVAGCIWQFHEVEAGASA